MLIFADIFSCLTRERDIFSSFSQLTFFLINEQSEQINNQLNVKTTLTALELCKHLQVGRAQTICRWHLLVDILRHSHIHLHMKKTSGKKSNGVTCLLKSFSKHYLSSQFYFVNKYRWTSLYARDRDSKNKLAYNKLAYKNTKDNCKSEDRFQKRGHFWIAYKQNCR